MRFCLRSSVPGIDDERHKRAGIDDETTLGDHAMKVWVAPLLMSLATMARAESIGEVDTVFKFIGPDHKIVGHQIERLELGENVADRTWRYLATMCKFHQCAGELDLQKRWGVQNSASGASGVPSGVAP